MEALHPRDDGSGRPTRAVVDLEAFSSNLALARRLGGGRAVMAVVKANAYGHGAVPVARAAAAAGADWLGVATLGEARELLDADLSLPIIVLSEPPRDRAAEAAALGCRQVVYTEGFIRALDEAAGAQGRRVSVHLKCDTGMGRVGALPGDVPAIASLAAGCGHLDLEGVMTHLAEADDPASPATARQLALFGELSRAVAEHAPGLRYRHAANSALLMRGEATGDLVRPGIMLYGSPPAPGFPGGEGLRPALTLVTAVSFLKRVGPGTPLSYGGTYRTDRASLVATLPVGYADGYPRGLSGRAEVLVRGRRAPIVGRVCMDMCLADVTGVPGAAVDDEVVLIGRQGDEEIRAEEIARIMDTIAYETYCAIGPRVPRVYAHRGEA